MPNITSGMLPGQILAIGMGATAIVLAPAVKILSEPLYWGGKKILFSVYDQNANPREDLKPWQKNCRKALGYTLVVFGAIIEGTAVIGASLGAGVTVLGLIATVAPYSSPLPLIVGLTTAVALLALGGYLMAHNIAKCIP